MDRTFGVSTKYSTATTSSDFKNHAKMDLGKSQKVRNQTIADELPWKGKDMLACPRSTLHSYHL